MRYLQVALVVFIFSTISKSYSQAFYSRKQSKVYFADEILSYEDGDIEAMVNASSSCLSTQKMKLADVSENSGIIRKTINSKQKFTATFLGLANISLGKDDFISMTDYIEYKTDICNDQEWYSVVGVRVSYIITDVAKGAQFRDGPKQLAAAAELGLAKVNVRLETIGWANNDSRKVIANWLSEPLTVDNYDKVDELTSNLLDMMSDDMEVTPKKINYSLIPDW